MHAMIGVWFLREKRNPIAVVFVQEVRAGDEWSRVVGWMVTLLGKLSVASAP